MKRLIRFLLAASAVALLAPARAAGAAAPRMYVGFHDDPNFRYEERRAAMLDQARDANATIVRTLVTWANVAPTRPANATNPFDPAYRFDDLDELVRNTQARGHGSADHDLGHAEVGERQQDAELHADAADRPDRTFSRAVASRYSGRFAGYPFVRFYSIWNESNLQLFLAPQFDSKGRSVGPRNYAKLAAAAYAGIKAGNSRAKVAIGSTTSSHGRDKAAGGQVGDALARPLRPARRRSQPAAQVRRLGAAPVSGAA